MTTEEIAQPVTGAVTSTTATVMSATVTKHAGLKLHLQPYEAEQFKRILFRGINTMDSPPQWAHDLYKSLSEVFP